MNYPFLIATNKGVRLNVRVQPNAKREEIVGLYGEALKIKIRAVPEDGKANIALCEFIASRLGISKSSVSLESGQTSRSKVLLIIGLDFELIGQKLLGYSTIE